MGRRDSRKRVRDNDREPTKAGEMGSDPIVPHQGEDGELKVESRKNKWTDMSDPKTFINEAFERHYKHQLGYALGNDEQWKSFHSVLATGLPTALRLNFSLPTAVQAHITGSMLSEFKAAGSVPCVLQWVEGGAAFQVPLSRGELKRTKENKRVKKLTNALNDGGYFSRQEAVSMIPALFLDVQPGDTVADLCAAPGSKTTQILEKLVKGGNAKGGGCMVANDVSSGRLDVLSHQTGRIAEAQSRLIITKHDATRFPLHSTKLFNRVLCDVMCSGDGTLRKSVDLWARWNANDGPALHNSQSQVLLRGMAIIKEGGTIVYSTCSMNPIEDEAVIYKCLKHAQGCFELVDMSDKFPHLKREKGIHTWSVMSKDAKECYATAEEAKEKSEKFKKYTDSMWPPTSEDAKAAHLERCARLLPNAQDTGGFFIAALRCVKEFRTQSNLGKVDASATSAMVPLSEEGKLKMLQVFQFTEEDRFDFENIYSRGEGARIPKFYYIQPATIQLMKNMDGKGFNVEQAGEKVFDCSVKKSMDSLRFVSEGCPLLANLLPPRFVRRLQFAKMPTFMAPGQDGRVNWGSWLSALEDKNESVPPRHFVCQVDTPGLGLMTFAATTSSYSADPSMTSVKVRVTEPQELLLRNALGEDIVPTSGTQVDDLDAEEEE